MRLSNFIKNNIEPILVEWEKFARTIEPHSLTMDSTALRDHAMAMLNNIAHDLEQPQSADEQFQKSLGNGPRLGADTAAEIHAAARLFSGFNVVQLVSEYRALRASVLKLWTAELTSSSVTDVQDITRFNEAVDQAVAESVARFSQMVAKSQHLFLAILGHDLRNPLATTSMASRYIMEGQGDKENHRTAAARIVRSCERMNGLVNDLIDYTRINLGSKIPVTLKRANIEQLSRDALTEHQWAYPHREFRLICDGSFDGHWDDNRIAQVLSNLISNAVQYGDSNNPIIVRLREETNCIVLSVESCGQVISPDKVNSIFEPLVRLAHNDIGPDGAKVGNLGIGLFIVREIILAHGGSINVTSDELDGTKFTVTLPR